MSATNSPQPQQGGGLPFAIGAYTLWGFIPLYLVLLNAVPPFALVGWRILWTIPICALIIVLRGQWPDVKAALLHRRTLGWLVISGVLITVNWVTYIIAVQRGAFYAASLGYYINPLVNVLLGTVFLHERLSRFQWLAVGVAAIGIAILAFEAGDTLYISLILAFSFAFYGLVRKRVPVGALPGLTIEALVLAVPAAITIGLTTTGESGLSGDWHIQALLFGAGIWTAIPLLLFATAARRMSYSRLGFVQFLAPTIVFILGLTVLDEPLDMLRLVSFIFIWVAIAIFCADLLHRNRVKKRPVPA
ncbi:EamA family transporter RarD [Croceicoccus mobilis]|uniref:Permease n=1 Tax=Croceicoccus mobilis TaxID=1703339 RepID=A0A916YZK6_9SPHN|nr:EamA family transporter RarD [Croceicoccus mobilis]GGD68643.1 permease [Croceicoccus mobilis]